MKTRHSALLATLGLALTLGACASTPATADADEAAAAGKAEATAAADAHADAAKAEATAAADAAAPMCPIEDLGNDVSFADVDGGLAITVTTTGDADALRAQMATRAAWIKAQAKDKPHAAMESRIEPVDGGFRRVVTAKDPSKVEGLRAAIRGHIAEERALQGEVPDAMPACALEVAETHADIQDVVGGLQVDITTSGDVAEVRRRVLGRDAYAKANPKPAPVAFTKQLTEIPGGIRILFTAEDSSKVDEMRTFLRAGLEKAHETK